MFGNFFIALSMLTILYIIGIKDFFYIKHVNILIFIITFIMFASIWLPEIYTFLLFIIYYFLIIIFSYIKLKSIFLASLYILIQNTLLTLVWVIGYDLPILLLNFFHYKGNQNSTNIFLYLFQLPLLLFFIWILSYLNNRYSIWKKISQFDKKRPFYGVAIFVVSNFILLYKQFLLIKEDFLAYIYASIVLSFGTILLLRFTFFTSQIYLDRLFIKHLKKKSIKDLRFLTLANEFQHDYKTFIITTKRYLELKDFVGLEDYLNTLQEYSTPLLDHSLFNQINMIKDPATQGILFHCVEQCQLKKLKLSLDINIQNIPENSFFNSINFDRCFSILVNNALEHSTEKIYISFTNYNGVLQCSVRNSITKSVEYEKIFLKNFSTKEGHSGLGLHILKNIIKHQRDVTFEVQNTASWISFSISNFI